MADRGRHRRGQVGDDRQRNNQQRASRAIRDGGRKYKAIYALHVNHAGCDRVPLGIQPYEGGRPVCAKLYLHRPLGRAGTARSGQDQREGQQKAGQGVGDPLHDPLVARRIGSFLDKDQMVQIGEVFFRPGLQHLLIMRSEEQA
jgi:hypothetical protein